MEVVISVVIFGLLMGGLVSAAMVASARLQVSRTDMRVWEVASHQLELLRADGYDGLASGSDTIEGLATSWAVSGSQPKMVVLVVQRPLRAGGVRPDSFVTYVADPTP